MQTLAPIVTTILGYVAWTIIVGGLIWVKKLSKVGERYTCPLVTGIRGGIFTLFAYFGLIFWEDIFNVLILGQLGYGNIRYFLAPLLLAAVSGTIFIVGGVFIAPTKRTLIFFGLLVGFALYTYASGEGLDILYEPILYVWVIEFVTTVVWTLGRKLRKKSPFEEPVLWDWSNRFKRILNPKVILGFWVVSFIELLLFLEGYSLFVGFEEINYWIWVLGTLAVAGFVVFLYRKINHWRIARSAQVEPLSPDPGKS